MSLERESVVQVEGFQSIGGVPSYLTESLLAPGGHTHFHLAFLWGVAGSRRVVEVLLQVLHPHQQLGYSTQEWKLEFFSLFFFLRID